MNTHMIKMLLLSLILGIMSGCAVLRVDVDVYKGPLADEEHIQIQRLGVMAIGAKPLLIQARDILAGEEYVKKLHEAGRYQEKFIPDSLLPIKQISECKSACKNKKCKKDCENYHVLSGRAFATDDGEYDTGLKSARIINSTLFLYEDEASGSIKNLINEGRFVLNQFNNAWNGFKDSQDQLDFLLKNKSIKSQDPEHKLLETLCAPNWFDLEPFSLNTFKGEDSSIDITSIDRFYSSIKNNQPVIESVAKKYFRDKKDQKLFISTLNLMARSFEDSWTAQRKLLRITLLAIIAMDKDRGPSSHDSKKQLDAAVELVANISQWGLTLEVLIGLEEKDTLFEEEYKEKIISVILKDPAANATKILSSDAYLSDKKVECFINNCNLSSFCTSKNVCSIKRGSRKFGLVYLPKNNIDGIANIEVSNKINKMANNLAQQFNTYSDNLAGFEKGRLHVGLESLIQLYLEEHDKDDNIKQTKKAQKRLADALVRFSEKLIYVAQNSAYVDVANIADGDSGDKEKEYENIFGIIEVVGNSILIQANELVAREQHKLKMHDKFTATQSSIAHEYTANTAQMLKRILSSVNSKAAQIKANKEKIDSLNNKLKEASDKRDVSQKAQKAKESLIKSIKLPADYQKHKTAVSLLEDQAIGQCLKNASEAQASINPAKNCLQYDTALKSYMSCINTELAKAVIGNNLERLDKLSVLQGMLKTYPNKNTCAVADFKTFVTDQFVMKAQIASKKLADIKKLQAEKAEFETVITAQKKIVLATTTEIKVFEKAHPDIIDLHKIYSSDAVAIINEEAATLLNVVNSDNVSGHLVMPQLISIINNLKALPAKKTAAENAIAILQKTPEPETIPAGLVNIGDKNSGKLKDARNPMDALIKWLETNRVRILHDQGKKSQAYINVTNALEVAYRDRAGLTYIRPASSYLRSSYTSTAVQQSNHLQWNNMIGDSYKRNIPLVGEAITNQDIHKALNEIDKQFWQNINTVRVSGGGVSNYVLAKDDIGNWTVRSYTTNYESMVKALKDMALFNYSQKLGTQLIDATNPDGTKNTTITSGGLNGLFASYQKAFADSRKNTYDQFKAKMTGSDLATQIKTKWDENTTVAASNTDKLNAAKTLVKDKYDTILKPMVDKLDEEDAIKGGDLIYDLLRSLRKFKAAVNDNLNSKLVDETTPTAAQQGIATAAKEDVTALIDGIIKTTTDAREKSVASYEQALLFIGEATNREDPKDEGEDK